MKRILRYTLWATAILVVLAAVAVVGLRLWSPYRQRAADRAWAESFEPMETLLARHPAAPDSPAALELAARAQRLGISMLPSPTPGSIGKAPASGEVGWKEEAKRFQPLVSFVGGQGTKAEDATLEAPPQEVGDFLSKNSGEIDAVEARILGPDPITWAIDIRKGADAPYPSLPGHRYLVSVLLARALEAARGGEGPAAERALEASWKLHSTLRERPELMSQLVSIAMTDLHNGVLRRVPTEPAEWAERLSRHDWRRAVLRSYQAEALQFTITAREGWTPASGGREASKPAEWAWRLVSRLFLELSLANYSEQMNRMAVEVGLQDPCSLDAAALSRRTEEAIPRWNILARIAMPSFARTWNSVGRAALGDELTRLVVQAKAQVPPAQASELPRTVPSSACAGVTWAVRALPSGDIHIEADRNPFQDPKTAPLLAFRVHRRPSRR